MHWSSLANALAGLLLLGKGVASVVEAPVVRPQLGRAYDGTLDGGNSSSFSLLRRQGSSPQCGAAANGARCTNNLCCSQWGYCGATDLYCSNVSGCQPAYGACEGSITTTTSATTTTTITSSSSTTSTVTTTTSSTSVTTSSTTTSSSSSSSSSSTASPTVPFPPGQTGTTDGTCGNNKSCLGWTYGQCCSQYGFCGSGDTYCSPIAGCQAAYGVCEGSSPTTTPGPPSTTSTSTSSSSSSSATITTTSGTTSTSSTSSSATASPTATLPPGQSTTTDGTCGNNKSCIGWAYGQCCSQWGYCGSSDTYCSPISSCQPNYGICDAA